MNKKKTITIVLPYPPSANTLFRNVSGRGRVKTERYRTWARVAGVELSAQRAQWPVKSITGPVHVDLTVQRIDNRKRDLDNLLKAPLDLLVSMGVIDDDSKIHSLAIRWGDVEGLRVEVSKYRGSHNVRPMP